MHDSTVKNLLIEEKKEYVQSKINELSEVINKLPNKDSALRYDTGKLQFELVPNEFAIEMAIAISAINYPDDPKPFLDFNTLPDEILIETARVFTGGARKYAKNNWMLGMDWSRCDGSLERHFRKWKMGQLKDTDVYTKDCYHLAQVIWNAGVLMYYQMYELGTNDMYFRGKDRYNFTPDYPSVIISEHTHWKDLENGLESNLRKWRVGYDRDDKGVHYLAYVMVYAGYLMVHEMRKLGVDCRESNTARVDENFNYILG